MKDYSLKIYFSVFLLSFGFAFNLTAQGSAGSNANNELISLIDLPTAGMLPKGNFNLTFDVLPKGVLITKAELGIIKNFSLGLSFGASNLVGVGKLNWYRLPGFHVKLRIFTETRMVPSFLIGFNSQGKGEYYKSENRYDIKSKGIYLASAKNFKFLGYLSFHGIINTSLENEKVNENINFGIGLEKTIGPTVSFIAEYDFALNDNESNNFGRGNGYMNIGLRWSASYGLTIGFDLRNLLDNKRNSISDGIERALLIEYIREIF
jgi:hypothetical protein